MRTTLLGLSDGVSDDLDVVKTSLIIFQTAVSSSGLQEHITCPLADPPPHLTCLSPPHLHSLRLPKLPPTSTTTSPTMLRRSNAIRRPRARTPALSPSAGPKESFSFSDIIPLVKVQRRRREDLIDFRPLHLIDDKPRPIRFVKGLFVPLPLSEIASIRPEGRPSGWSSGCGNRVFVGMRAWAWHWERETQKSFATERAVASDALSSSFDSRSD